MNPLLSNQFILIMAKAHCKSLIKKVKKFHFLTFQKLYNCSIQYFKKCKSLPFILV